MLQFNATVCNITTKFTSRLCWRFTASFATSSTMVASESTNMAIKPAHNARVATPSMNEEQRKRFNELKMTVYNSLNNDSLAASKIQNAQNVHDLLNLIKMPHFSQKEIINVMNTIVTWVHNNNTSVTNLDVYKKAKEIKESVEKIMPKPHTNVNVNREEYAQYYDLSTSAMIQEVLRLAHGNDRNLKVVRFLFDNIIQYNKELKNKQCSGLLFSMCCLSYADERLLNKISNNLIKTCHSEHMSTLSSSIKSMAILRYKNEEFLNHICKILIESDCSGQYKHIAKILLSYAVLGYESDKLHAVVEKYLPYLTPTKLGYNDWLNFVWSLVILNIVKSSCLLFVLNETFVEKVMSQESASDSKNDIVKQLKLLNINAAAQYIAKDYSGPLLDETQLPCIVNIRTKQKEQYISVLEETLKQILPSSSFKMNVNTTMGFLLDAECYVTSELQPVSDVDTEKMEAHKVAILVHDYHDYCLDKMDLQGINKFYNRLLTASGYRVLNISYQHFGIEDVSTKRIAYLKRRLQSLKEV